MNIVIIPGFVGFPEEKTFEELDIQLSQKGHTVIKIAWPNFPNDLNNYNFTNTIASVDKTVRTLENQQTMLLGSSMGGIIACEIAKTFKPDKLGLLVTPYQAGTEDDLQGKYKSWKEMGYRDLTSSRFGDLRIPFSFIEDARKYNALDTIGQINSSILFIVCEKDDKVPNSVTHKIFDKANEPKQWIQIKDMEHKYQYQPEILDKVNQELIRFIES